MSPCPVLHMMTLTAMPYGDHIHLLIIILRLISNHIEELEAVLSFAGANHTQPITKLLLLEELLSQVLEVPAREILVCDNLDPSISQIGNGDGVAQVTSAAFDLDALLEESGEGGWVEDAVLGRLGCVDDEL